MKRNIYHQLHLRLITFVIIFVFLCSFTPVNSLPLLDEIISLPLQLIGAILSPLGNLFPFLDGGQLPQSPYSFLHPSQPLISPPEGVSPVNPLSDLLDNFITRAQNSIPIDNLELPNFQNERFSELSTGNSDHLTTPLFGSIHKTAYYFVDAIIGSNFQRQSLIIDTGSSVLALACDDCASCGTHLDEPFRCAESHGCLDIPCRSTCNECTDSLFCEHCVNQCPICSIDGKSCTYDVHYAEGSSITGSWHIDFFYFPQYDPHSKSESLSQPILTSIGCHQKETNLFLDQAASGILGLQYFSIYGPRTFLDSALKDSISHEKVLALCLSQEGGLMSLGRSLDEYHLKTSSSIEEFPYISWVSRIPLQKSYQIQLLSIQVADYPPIHISRMSDLFSFWGAKRYATLDSGTTLTYFPSDIYGPLITTFHQFLSKNKKFLSVRNTTRLLFELDEEHMRHRDTSDYTSLFQSNQNNKGKNDSDRITSFSNDYQPSLFDNILEIPWDEVDSSFPMDAKPRHVKELLVNDQKSCWYLPNGDYDLQEFPVLKLTFESYQPSDSKINYPSTIEWHPNSYLYSRGSPKRRCLSIESHQQILLGATFFINKDIIFDYSNPKRIGIAEAACPKFQYVDRYQI